MTCSNLVHS